MCLPMWPSWGMSNAAATLVGQNLGARKPDRAERSVWLCAWYNVAYLAIVSLVFILQAENIVSIFNQDPEVVRVGAIALRYIGFGYIFYAFGMVISQAFNGAGDTRTPTWINFFCFWLFEIPLAYFLSMGLDMGPSGIFSAISISAFTTGIVCIIVFRRGKWKTVEV